MIIHGAIIVIKRKLSFNSILNTVGLHQITHTCNARRQSESMTYFNTKID